jgi:hypothetical protein
VDRAGIRDIRATGTVLSLPAHFGRKAEALHLADRTSEALEAINEAEALAERFEYRSYCAELHRLRGVFLTTLGADETQIEASFVKSRLDSAICVFFTRSCRIMDHVG